jgi:hypothetical protein
LWAAIRTDPLERFPDVRPQTDPSAGTPTSSTAALPALQATVEDDDSTGAAFVRFEQQAR